MTGTLQDTVPTSSAAADRRSGWWASTLVRHVGLAVVGGLLLYVLSISLDPFRDLQLAQICYIAIAAAGLTMLSGLSGQISLGHGALMAVGGYTAAVLFIHVGWPLVVVLLAATLLTGVFGIFVGLVAARLRGPYLAGVTLAFAVGLPSLATYSKFRGLLGGGNGLAVETAPPPLRLGETFPLERWQAWICGLCLVIVFLLLANLMGGRTGRDMRLVREDEQAAALSGVHVARTQVIAFTVSAACAGLAGALFSFVNSLASPGSFPLSLSLALLTAAVVGGLGRLAGAVYGAVIVTLLPSWLGDLANVVNLSRSVYANLPLVIYGAVLILVILLFPRGVQGGLSVLSGRLLALLRRDRATTAGTTGEPTEDPQPDARTEQNH